MLTPKYIELMLRIYCAYAKSRVIVEKTRLKSDISEAGFSIITPHFSTITRLLALALEACDPAP
jgi:capsular polysaccharide biosynthesis protein